MREIILQKLKEIEQTENVRILIAVESGSRAWGFESPDSDYDVRFIYARPKTEYLRLDTIRDVIELPLDGILDINGWDLKKTLQLLYKSNPTLFEWFSSPTVYMETDFADKFRKIMNRYFVSKHSLYHYISMSEGNYREYLRKDMVRAKKYFYVLRPVLACRWILDKGTPPPMLFSELAESQLDKSLKPYVDNLLELKMNSPEVKEIPKIDVLNEYLENSITEIKNKILEEPDIRERNWELLNELFLSELDNF